MGLHGGLRSLGHAFLRLRAVDRKLLREVKRLKGQVATIAIVLASGMASFIGMRGNYESLQWSLAAYYDRTRFGHLFVSLERAPESVAERLRALPGVALVETRVVEEVRLPMEGMARPAFGVLASLPDARESSTNRLVLRRGDWPPSRQARQGNDSQSGIARDADADVVVLESFANAHGLSPGSRIPAVINGKLRRLRVAGVALSPEYVYAIRPGAMADDPRGYAVLWMRRSALASALGLEGAFNDASLLLQPNVSEAAVRTAVDRVLAPHGGNGAVGRRDQLSNKIVTAELAQLSVLAAMVPLVFLGVAAFLINLVLGRLIALQRAEIATLKAIGYRNREVGRHYLGLVAVVMVPATLLGIGGGLVLGRIVVRLYASVFRIPDLAFRLSAPLVATALLVSVAAAVGGALLAVRAAVRLPPAEAMRPAAPARYRTRLGAHPTVAGALARKLARTLAGPQTMMVLREIGRRPIRTALSGLGIAGAVALLILGRFGTDSLDSYLETVLRREQRQSLTVSFVRPLPERAVSEVAHLPGVLVAEGMRSVAVRAKSAQRSRETALIALPQNGGLRRLITRSGRQARLPPGGDGVLVSQKLAEVLDLRAGERIELEIRQGERQTLRPVIADLLDESVGLFVYAGLDTYAALVKDLGAVSAVLVEVDPAQRPALEARLRDSPRVLDVSDLEADVARMRDMNAAAMDVWTLVSIVLATAVIFGVVYNNARIAVAMRSRDLASLRVLGFSRREISTVLIGGLAVEVAFAIPVGLLLGRLWASAFMRSIDQETFRWAAAVAPRTYLFSALVALLAATASALWVRRSLDRLDLIGVLKTRE